MDYLPFWETIASDYKRKRSELNDQMKYISGNGYSIGVLLDSLKYFDECIERMCKNCEFKEQNREDSIEEAKRQLKRDPDVMKKIRDELLNDPVFTAPLKSSLASKTIKELKAELKQLKGE